MERFGINLQGRINNFFVPLSKPLLPLFETIANSFHAIEERQAKDPNFNNGEITIRIEREYQESFSEVDEAPIRNIIVEDNGIGFNEENFRSFLQSDSTYKASIGGKGVGRFSWLVTFESATVSSDFVDETGTFVKRTFDFSLDTNEFDDSVVESDRKEYYTSVKLYNYKTQYQAHAPKQLDTLATKIIEHFLVFFFNESCPTVRLADKTKEIIINDYIKKKIQAEKEPEVFDVENHQFELLHVRINDASIIKNNQLFLCANDRPVEVKEMDTLIVDLNKGFIEKNSFCYVGLLKGKYFDDNVDMNRLSFKNIPDGGFNNYIVGYITMDSILRQATKKIKEYLKSYLDPVTEKKISRIKKYVNDNSPQYRHLFKYMASDIEQIKPDLSDAKLDDELHRISRKFDLQTKGENAELLKAFKDGIISDEEYIEKFKTQVEKISDSNSAVLADYIAHRKVVLDLLSVALNKDDDDKYQKERYIHNLIYPMRTTSDEGDRTPYLLNAIQEVTPQKPLINKHFPLVFGHNLDTLAVFSRPFQSRKKFENF